MLLRARFWRILYVSLLARGVVPDRAKNHMLSTALRP